MICIYIYIERERDRYRYIYIYIYRYTQTVSQSVGHCVCVCVFVRTTQDCSLAPSPKFSFRSVCDAFKRTSLTLQTIPAPGSCECYLPLFVHCSCESSIVASSRLMSGLTDSLVGLWDRLHYVNDCACKVWPLLRNNLVSALKRLQKPPEIWV